MKLLTSDDKLRSEIAIKKWMAGQWDADNWNLLSAYLTDKYDQSLYSIPYVDDQAKCFHMAARVAGYIDCIKQIEQLFKQVGTVDDTDETSTEATGD